MTNKGKVTKWTAIVGSLVMFVGAMVTGLMFLLGGGIGGCCEEDFQGRS
ncbi:MAG: hypothetical protein FWG90_00905 [Oscillospiraceae bacterium]|nr:hypothetical protein [Oscillospiraceae bacterium]